MVLVCVQAHGWLVLPLPARLLVSSALQDIQQALHSHHCCRTFFVSTQTVTLLPSTTALRPYLITA